MSTVSMDGSEWSGINQYQSSGKSELAISPNPGNQGNLPTPPASGNLVYNALGSNPPETNGLAPPMRSNGVSQNPSPPSSVVSGPRSRASDGTLSDQNSRRYRRMVDLLSQHYVVLDRFLQGARGNDANDMRTNRARDKLLRLSPVQFLELSTDVFDELQRRQAGAAAARAGPGPPRPDVPPHLLPRGEFHAKRNQARKRLAALQPQRFKELAMDVFCEHERRFPHLAGGNMSRRGSPAPSLRGGRFGPSPGPELNGMGRGSRGPPPGPGGRGYSPNLPGNRFPPRQGSLSAAAPTGLGINGETIPENAPYQKTFQSNTIVPNKSTLVEDDESAGFDDDEDNRRSDAFALDKVLESRRGTTTTLAGGFSERDNKKLAEAEAQVSALQSKVEELESLLKRKEKESERLGDEENKLNALEAEKLQWENLKNELTNKLLDAQNLNESLRNDLDNARRQQDAMEREMQEELEQIRLEQQKQQQQPRQKDVAVADSGDGEWKIRFDKLDREHQALKAEFQQQQEVTDQVRQQAFNALEEMRALASGSNWEQEENLTREVHRLEEEVKRWKNRYAKVKTQQRHLRSSSLGLPGHIQDATVFAKGHELAQPDGLVKDVHVTKFQIAIDELLRIARMDEPPLVLEQMKTVVVAVRLITRDIEAVHGKGDDYSQPRNRVRSRVSATANNLITASKNFANSNGLSPVSLLDAAASHLTAAIVELIRNVKIRPTSEDELAEEDELDNLAPMQSPGYFSTAPSQSRFSGNESVYSAISSPSMRSRSQTHSRIAGTRNTSTSGQSLGAGMKLGFGAGRGPDRELEELRIYLEDQTEGLVQAIQALVASIRAEDDISVVQTHITSISSVVKNVVASTDAIAQPNANPALRERAGPVVEMLSSCCRQLVDAGQRGDQVRGDPEQMREVTGKLPPIAFQIARETKELVQRVDQLEMESREEDDFR
ncbi:component of the polarisome [Emydomyces testavorans]|uniref:Component of the polarisome n=1 Tax=Emydomyces testavorans TaxID=2070801 RepID=A0AAF0IJS0_9EURO|nr:component of the polarisome [Emydomyces testavorans]